MHDYVAPALRNKLKVLLSRIEPPKPVVFQASPVATSKASNNEPAETQQFDLQFLLLDKTGECIADVPYLLQWPDGALEEGVTAIDGYTQVSATKSVAEKLRFFIAEDYVLKSNNLIEQGQETYAEISKVKLTLKSDHEPIEVKIDKLEPVEIVDVVQVTGEDTLYLLTKEEQNEILVEIQYFDDISKRLNQAISVDQDNPSKELLEVNVREEESRISTQLQQSKTEVLEELIDNGVLDVKSSSMPVKLTEVRRLAGDKHFSYIRSDKMKNHWRSYKMDAKDRDRKEGWLTENKIDKDKLFKKLKKELKTKKVKLEIKETLWEANFSAGNPVYDALNTYYGQRKASIWGDEAEAKKNETGFDASLSGQVFRFAAGAALATEFDPKKGKVAFQAGADASFDLVNAQAKASYAFPAANYAEINIPYYISGESVPRYIKLGSMQAELTFMASGFAGATAMLGANLDIDCSSGKPRFKSNGQGLTGEAGAFAGVKAGGGIEGALKWKDNLTPSADWSTLCSFGEKIEAALGAGAEAEFSITYNDASGKFILRCHAGLVVGVGASGSFDIVISANEILVMVHFIFDALRKVDYRKIDMFHGDDTFEIVVQLYLYGLLAGVGMISESLDFLSEGLEEVARFFDEELADFKKERQSLKLARNVLKDVEFKERSWLLHSPPEVKGRLLYILTYDSGWMNDWVGDEEVQREAAWVVLNSMQSERDYNESLSRMNSKSQKSNSEINSRKLFKFLGKDRLLFESKIKNKQPRLGVPVSLDPWKACDCLIA